MSTLTAEEWNQRYPVGTLVLSWTHMDRSDEPSVTRTRSAAWQLGDGTPVVSVFNRTGGYHLACAEPLFTDDQRVAAGWLPPDEAERLKADLAVRTGQLNAARRHADGADDYAARLKATDDACRRQCKQLCEVEVRLAAVQPVIDAARALRATIRLTAATRAAGEDDAGLSVSQQLILGDLLAAVDALDADSPPEGPTQ